MRVQAGGTEPQLLTRRPTVEMRAGFSAATATATSREAASSGQGPRRPRVPAPPPRGAPAAGAAAQTAAAAATERLGEPASRSTCCSAEGAAQPRAAEMFAYGQLPGSARDPAAPPTPFLPPPALAPSARPGERGRGAPSSGLCAAAPGLGRPPPVRGDRGASSRAQSSARAAGRGRHAGQ